MTCERVDNFERGVDLGFAVVDVAGVAHAKLIALRVGSKAAARPEFAFELFRRDTFNAVHHRRARQAGRSSGTSTPIPLRREFNICSQVVVRAS